MSDPPSYDQDLLSRLNALKKSSISLDASKSTPLPLSSSREATLESTLSDRLRSLRNSSTSTSPSPVAAPKSPIGTQSRGSQVETDPLRDPKDPDADEKTLDELLADLGDEEEWGLNPDDSGEIRKMLAEAKKTLQDGDAQVNTKLVAASTGEGRELTKVADEERKKVRSKGRQEFLTADLDMSVFAHDEKLDEDEDEDIKGIDLDMHMTREAGKNTQLDIEAEEIIRKMLDEVSLEKSQGLDEPSGKDNSGGLSLPSAPTKLPELAPVSGLEPDDFEKNIATRMAALESPSATNSLGLPSAPTFKPADKPAKGVQKTYKDEEIESWCIICNDDATVQCMGCDGELYCANCWKEGHMGLDVGLEEKLHKWRKFIKPR